MRSGKKKYLSSFGAPELTPKERGKQAAEIWKRAPALKNAERHERTKNRPTREESDFEAVIKASLDAQVAQERAMDRAKAKAQENWGVGAADITVSL